MRVIDGQATYRCHECQDTGVVDVWAPQAMRAALRGIEGLRAWLEPKEFRGLGHGPATLPVACACGEGKGGLPAFDDARMVRVRSSIACSFEDEQERLVEAVNGRRVPA